MSGYLSDEGRADFLRDLRASRDLRSGDVLEAPRRLLLDLVSGPNRFLQLPLERKAGAYARTLLAGDDEVSIWAIVWASGASTPIHDHHCSCCFGVVSGTVEETWYRAIGGGKAIPTRIENRSAGYVACMTPTGPNIHRMQNLRSEDAISIHIYGFDHEVHASSIENVYTATNG